MAEYTEDEMLMLSGIQHYMFCPRQWALIHVEQQWDDNKLTTEGELLHEHVDDPFYRQKNGAIITLRSVSIASKKLGLYGLTDIVELLPTDSRLNAVTHPKYSGYWKPHPVEYKCGNPKPDERDEVQLAAQVMCLEEMYGITIDYGSLFYWETRRREVVLINDELRSLTMRLAEEMHDVFKRGVTPRAEKKSHCRSCSLYELCLPQLNKKQSVSNYLKSNLYEETA